MMQAKPGIGFKIWTAFLSVFVAVMLFPNIVRKHGPVKSLLITALAVGAIWLMYAVVGRAINGAVSKELKRKAANPPRDGMDAKTLSGGPGRKP